MEKHCNTVLGHKNHSGYITSLECKGEFMVIRICHLNLN